MNRPKRLINEKALELHYSSFVADLHADTLLWDKLLGYDMLKEHRPKFGGTPFLGHVDAPRMVGGGVSLQAFAIVPNYWYKKREIAEKYVSRMQQIVRHTPMLQWALSGSEAEAARRNGNIGVFLGLEGAHPLEGKPENLKWFYDNGVRYISLTHFNKTEAAYPSLFSSRRDKGLTVFGKELITAMNEIKMMVDLAHINRGGFFEAIELSSSPVIVSHTVAKGLSNHPRGIDDEQIKAVAKKGGVIGIMFSPLFLCKKIFCASEMIVKHIDYIRKTAGIDCIALGSDFDGMIHLPRDMRGVNDLPILTQTMLDWNYSEEEIRKVLGLNFLRVYKEVCG